LIQAATTLIHYKDSSRYLSCKPSYSPAPQRPAVAAPSCKRPSGTPPPACTASSGCCQWHPAAGGPTTACLQMASSSSRSSSSGGSVKRW
jgi:hypothetical protein